MARTLVCFAVKEEAGPFRAAPGAGDDLEVLVTGMGRRNAERSLRAVLAARRPDRVFTCGFAGALHPDLACGAVLFAGATPSGLRDRLLQAGAIPGRFHGATRVAVTAVEKRALRAETGADAVDMESTFLQAVCAEAGLPAVVVRAISDVAHEDLPLDFNRLMTTDDRLHFGRLLAVLARSPGRIAGLLQLQRQARRAAERLAAVLRAALGPGVGGAA